MRDPPHGLRLQHGRATGRPRFWYRPPCRASGRSAAISSFYRERQRQCGLPGVRRAEDSLVRACFTADGGRQGRGWARVRVLCMRSAFGLRSTFPVVWVSF
ncbi:hypothetical protein B0H10DRAFT_2043850 [Mycena sp. CBHHK59/15]|nr:hypothetical protein B0H10DRAFT_2043850 [Mycena sp. CBHHK59/15]